MAKHNLYVVLRSLRTSWLSPLLICLPLLLRKAMNSQGSSPICIQGLARALYIFYSHFHARMQIRILSGVFSSKEAILVSFTGVKSREWGGGGVIMQNLASPTNSFDVTASFIHSSSPDLFFLQCSRCRSSNCRQLFLPFPTCALIKGSRATEKW